MKWYKQRHVARMDGMQFEKPKPAKSFGENIQQKKNLFVKGVGGCKCARESMTSCVACSAAVSSMLKPGTWLMAPVKASSLTAVSEVATTAAFTVKFMSIHTQASHKHTKRMMYEILLTPRPLPRKALQRRAPNRPMIVWCYGGGGS